MATAHCPSCSNAYEINPARIPAKGSKMRCPLCDARFLVYPDGRTGDTDASRGPVAPNADLLGQDKSDPDAIDRALDKHDTVPPRSGASSHQNQTKPRRAHADLPTPSRGGASASRSNADLPVPSSSRGGARSQADLPTPSASGQGARDAEVDLPAPASVLDVPQPVRRRQESASALGGSHDEWSFESLNDDLSDLPATRADLPGVRADLPGTRADLPGVRTDLPGTRADLPDVRRAPQVRAEPNHDRNSGSSADDELSFGSLDLQRPSNEGEADLSSHHSDSDDVLSVADELGALELNLDSAPPEGQGSYEGLHDDFSFTPGDADRLSLAEPYADPAQRHGALGAPGLEAELRDHSSDAAVPGAAPIQRARPRPRHSASAANADDSQAKQRRWVVPLMAVGAVALLVGAGFALSNTKYGVFGRYAVETYLPSYGDPEVITQLIQDAEKLSIDGSFVGMRQTSEHLAKAISDYPSNRELLGRGLLHEALFQLRYGEQASHSELATKYRRELELRGDEGKNTQLALAAYALQQNRLQEASQHINAARESAGSDPYVSLVQGLVSLKNKRFDEAVVQFQQAHTQGLGARALWQIAIAKREAGDGAGFVEAVGQTLKKSPTHIAAASALAQKKLDEGDFKTAHAVLSHLNLEKLNPSMYNARELSSAVLLSAKIHEDNGRRGAAREAYAFAIRLDPTNWDAMLGAGRALLAEQAFTEALSRFQAVIAAGGRKPADATGQPADWVQAKLGAVAAHLGLHNVEAAAAEVKPFEVDVPVSAAAEVAVADVARAEGQIDDAIKHYRNAIRLEPKSFAPYMALSQLFVAEGRRDEAVAVLVEAERAVERSAVVFRSKGEAELQRNRPESAVQEFTRAIVLEPNDAASHFGLAEAYRRQGQLKEAEQELLKVVEIDSSFPGVAVQRGQMAEAQGKLDEAIAIYREAVASNPEDLQASTRLAAALVETGKLDEAESILKSVLQSKPFASEATHYLGRVALLRDDVRVARDFFERAVRLDPQSGVFRMYVGRAALEMNELTPAISALNAAIDLNPNLGEAYWLRAQLHTHTGQVQDALNDAKRALELSPGLSGVHATMGESYDRLGQDSEAIAAYKRALKEQPNHAHWWWQLGRIYQKVGDNARAVDAMREVVEHGVANDASRTWLSDAFRVVGDADYAAGRKEAAIVHYGRFLELAPQSALDREEIEQRLAKMSKGR